MNISKVLGLQRNNEVTMDEMFSAYYKKAYKMALSKTRTVEEAEDLCMETFERACRFFHTYDNSMPLEAWLYKIMANVTIDNYKKSFKAHNPNLSFISLDKPIKTPEGEIDLEIPDTDGNPEKILTINDNRERVRRAIDSLDYEHKQVVVLADIQNKKYEEIAQIVGIPIGTVRSRLFRARQELKNMLID